MLLCLCLFLSIILNILYYFRLQGIETGTDVELQKEIDRLNRVNANLRKRLETCSGDDVNKLQDELHEARELNDQLSKTIETLNAKVDSLNTRLGESEKQITKLTDDLEDSREKETDYYQRYNKYKNLYGETLRQLNNCRDETEAFVRQTNELQTRVQSLLDENKRLKEECKNTQSAVEDLVYKNEIMIDKHYTQFFTDSKDVFMKCMKDVCRSTDVEDLYGSLEVYMSGKPKLLSCRDRRDTCLYVLSLLKSALNNHRLSGVRCMVLVVVLSRLMEGGKLKYRGDCASDAILEIETILQYTKD